MPHAMKTLANLPVMQGNRVGVITYSGGAGIMVSDGLEKHNLCLAAFSAGTIDQLAALSPQWLPLTNPLDIWPAVMLYGARRAYSVALKAVLNDPEVDGVICIAIAPLPEFSFLDVSETLNAVMDESPTRKPVIVWTYGPNTAEVQKRFESRNRIMVYPTLELATWALSLLRDRYKAIYRDRKS
jgi:acetyltransferase